MENHLLRPRLSRRGSGISVWRDTREDGNGFDDWIWRSEQSLQRTLLQTTNGTFEYTGRVELSRLTIGAEDQQPMALYVQQGKFEVQGAGAPKFVAIPLFNCAADPSSTLHRDHPLR